MANITGSQPRDGNGLPIRFTGWDATNGQYVVDESVAGTAAAGQPFSYAAKKVALSSANSGLPVNLPTIVQKFSAKSTGSVASLAGTFASQNIAGNSIIVVCGIGNGTDPTIADTNGNLYTKAITAPNSTTFESSIWYAVNIGAGTGLNTVTVTNAGSAASMAMEIYEVSGLIAQVTGQPGQTSTGTGTGTTASTSNISPGSPNHLAFAGVAVGTAAQTITAGTNWTNDSGQQNPTTPAGLYSFASLSQYLPSIGNYAVSATIASSEPWAMAVATFRAVNLSVEGTVRIAGYNYTNVTSKTTTVIKTGGGVLHRIVINAPGTADTLTLYDNTAGSGTKIGTVTVTAGYPLVYNTAFSTGLTVVSGGTTAGDYTIVWK